MSPRRDRLRFLSIVVFLVGAIAALVAVACGGGSGLVLAKQVDARQLASDIRVQFTMAADAANQAVMADTDEASAEAARAARENTQRVQHDVDELRPILNDLNYANEVTLLDEFNRQFAEYRKLDDAVLGLAVENTNLKAQRLSFTTARESFDAFRKALESLSRAVPPEDRWHVEALIPQATAALLEVQVVQAQHIAESDDAAMTSMEARMAASEAAARKTLTDLKALIPPTAAAAVADATAALDRFQGVNADIIQLSRRNTNVRSLALTLGEKRTLTAKCEAALQGLTDRLAEHEFKATR